ncbi:DHS-like NAD/FAD-binding domain-containing protein [Exidia glandulosa HHB12029]|uniref:DHS-like NAD/FAD-binding domain-containing protein n=1 Tax=Exidia glandulosa HHB12029 TaxID=1314781 RepID=A0A165QQG0_EXIGL|nr:DHS-like NAD/FAD-binding domain-containing protein [Exidia glandulosa HHB12029]
MTVTHDLASIDHDAHARRALGELSLLVAKSKRVVVVTGAGISCSSGIPDFRSSDGLYSLVKQRYPDVVMKGRDLFDACLFRDPASTSLFYSFIAELKIAVDKAEPGPTHRFVKTLHSKNKLLRSYTQNIDGFEAREGLLCSSSQDARSTGKSKNKLKVKDVKNVQLHGDIHRVRCTVCSADYPCSPDFLDVLREGDAPDCPECLTRSADRVARSARSIRVGTLRPAIVLYDEPHPYGDEIGAMCTGDLARKPDLLIIMGTSLKVHGIKKLVKDFAKAVHAHPAAASPKNKTGGGKVIFVNKTAPGSEWAGIIDVHVEGETDAWVDKVIRDWKKSRPADWEIQKTLDSTEDSFAVTKRVAGKAGKSKTNKSDAENIPPIAFPKPSQAAPSSPSKRRSNAEDGGSPRKKRMQVEVELPAVERGLLFGTSNAARVS